MTSPTSSNRPACVPTRRSIARAGRTVVLAALALTSFTARPANGAAAAGHPEPTFANVRLSTGVDLHYAVQGDESGTPLIMLHGYTDSWYSFSRLLPLIPTSYRAYALDQRGHGDSGQPDAGYAMEDMARDVIAFMDAMGLERATLVGHSMGSFVAQKVGLIAPERVDRTVLISTATTPRSFPAVEAFGQAVNGLPDRVPPAFAREFQESTVYKPVPEEFMTEIVRVSAAVPARVWRGAMIGMLTTDPPVGLGDHRIPTLILWGDHDYVFLRPQQDALMALLPSARFRAYAGVGHAPHWEDPQAVARDLLDFMAWEDTGTR